MYGKFKTQLDPFWHCYIPPILFSSNPFPSAKSFQFMNFSEAMLYENYLTSDFHTLLFQACLPTRQNGVENRDKAYCAENFIINSHHVLVATRVLDTQFFINVAEIAPVLSPFSPLPSLPTFSTDITIFVFVGSNTLQLFFGVKNSLCRAPCLFTRNWVKDAMICQAIQLSTTIGSRMAQPLERFSISCRN